MARDAEVVTTPDRLEHWLKERELWLPRKKLVAA